MIKIKISMLMLPKQDFSVNNIHYDKNGNLLSLNRAGISNVGLPRDQLTYQYNQGTNQLNHVLDAADATSDYDDDFKGQNPNNYIYNQAGKLEEDQQQNTKYIYNAMGKVSQVRKLDTDALILSIEYNTNGQRLKKTTYNQEGEPQKHTWYVNSSAGVLLATYEQDIANEDLEATLTQTPIYGLERIGVQNYTTTATGVRQTLAANYELKDHLGNVRVVILDKKDSRGNAIPISVNNFYPFGGNMPGETHSLNPLASNIGYQGQMYDAELGLYAFDLRMYNPHLGRWLNPDPYRQHYSPYLAMSNNPVSFVDPDGGWDEPGKGPDIYVDGMKVSNNEANFYFRNLDMVESIDGSYHFFDFETMRAIHHIDFSGLDLSKKGAYTTINEAGVYDPNQKAIIKDPTVTALKIYDFTQIQQTFSQQYGVNRSNVAANSGGRFSKYSAIAGGTLNGLSGASEFSSKNLNSTFRILNSKGNFSPSYYYKLNAAGNVFNGGFGIKTYSVANVSKSLTRNVTGVGAFIGAAEIRHTLKQEGEWNRSVSKKTTEVVGGFAGALSFAYVGAAAGGVAGSALFGVGSIPGAVVGAGTGFVFGIFGGHIGAKSFGKAFDAIVD